MQQLLEKEADPQATFNGTGEHIGKTPIEAAKAMANIALSVYKSFPMQGFTPIPLTPTVCGLGSGL